jgi:3'-phosphoadenosine 5'-phosphosulfate sulfotransferase (PAPS reductase)/FAD synthetase
MGREASWKRLEIWGGQNRRRAEISGALTTDENLNRQRRAGMVNGETGEGGVFSNPVEQFGQKSQFNKEKWLPLAREAPFLISHYCCFKMKKSPMHKYQTAHKYKPILATLAEESRVRKQAWIRHGCNAFESKNPMSQPMSFWTEQDVLAYIVKYNVQIASVYGDIVSIGSDGNSYPAVDVAGNVQCNLKCSGCQRTGCIFCAFGAHLEKGETRFQSLAKTHPRQYEYCIGGGEWIDNPFYDPAAPVWDGEWKNWNPKKIWSRNGKGLGLGKVFDICNEMYGEDFIRYE